MIKIFIYFLKNLFFFVEKISNFFRLLFFKKYKYELINSTSKDNKFLILATFLQQDTISRNLVDFLKYMKENNFNIVLVNDGIINSNIKKIIKPYCYLISERKNLGADFASYKFGFEILKKKKVIPDYIIFCNDSCFFLNDRLYYTLQKIESAIEKNFDVIGITENFKEVYHLQTFFFVVKKEVFLSKQFEVFWKKYRPYKNRNHRINKGEMGLTKVFKNFSIYVIFKESDIIDKIIKFLSSNSLYDNFLSSYYKLTDKNISFIDYLKLFKFNKYNSNYKDFLSYDVSIKQDGNLMNIFALYLILIKEINFPLIKKDIYFSNQFALPEIIWCIQKSDIDIDLKKEIVNYYRSRGSLRYYNLKTLIFDHFSFSLFKNIFKKYLDY